MHAYFHLAIKCTCIYTGVFSLFNNLPFPLIIREPWIEEVQNQAW